MQLILQQPPQKENAAIQDLKTVNMKNARGISRWTSAGRNHAVHILNNEGSLVLCKRQFFSHDTEALDIEKVTCKKCLSVFQNLNKAIENCNQMPVARGLPFMADMTQAILAGWKSQSRRLAGLDKVNNEPDKWDLHNLYTKENNVTAIFRHTDTGRLLEIKCPYGQPGNHLWVREEHYRFGHWVKAGRSDKGHQKFVFVADSKEVRYCDNPPENFYKSRHKTQGAVPAWYKRNARFMPKLAARIFLRITDIRCQRLKQISEADAVAEGIYRWSSLNKWFAELRQQVQSKKILMKEKILFLLQREKELRKKILDGPVYRLYIASIEVPLELAVTSYAQESFITLFLSINGQGIMDLNNPKNDPWLWALSFERIEKPSYFLTD